MDRFELVSDFDPTGDQPEAIDELIEGLNKGDRAQTLLGITGSGKTFTMANVIAKANRPTLVLSHNKTLAAQLYSEFKAFFPNNAVEYFVSYYDYYQPESYIPSTDTYIEKDTDINDDLEKLRFKATGALIARKDVIIVASVSCIFGLGLSLEDYKAMHLTLDVGQKISRDDLITRLVEMQYQRHSSDPKKGGVRVTGDVVEVYPPGEDFIYRIESDEDKIDRLDILHLVTREVLSKEETIMIYPARHFATPPEKMEAALRSIEEELEESLKELRDNDDVMKAFRLETKTRNDMEMIKETGSCKSIENYSRHFTGRSEGEPPFTLIDYFPKDFLMIVDESHVTLPQVRAMYKGDRSRKQTLIDYGFRMRSALDNRPLKFEEFEDRINQVVFTSATPGDHEIDISDNVVEQIVRPTGLLDPKIELKPTKNQVDDLMDQIHKTIENGNRVLVTTLTKRMAEDLSEYMSDNGVNARYMHSEIDTLDRVEILRDLRKGEFDVLVGINLLREGLDMPQVELVAILDADKEGFLRSERSLIQTIGRASRNENGRVVMYADKMTGSMERAIETTRSRRLHQRAYNKKHGLVPLTISKTGELMSYPGGEKDTKLNIEKINHTQARGILRELEKEMKAAAKRLDFEYAAKLRDEIKEIRNWLSDTYQQDDMKDSEGFEKIQKT